MASTGPLRLGLVGAGYIAGSIHLPLLSRLPEARVVGLCDEDVEKARNLGQRFHIPRVYGDVDEMLGRVELDLVDICVPPTFHGAVITKALEAGIPCLVEKPLTVTTAEADGLIALAQKEGVSLHVLHTFSVLPGILRAKEMVRRGAVGQLVGIHINYMAPFDARHLYTVHWCHSLPGDYFSDLGPHLAMLLVEFLGPVRLVESLTAKLSAYASMRLDEVRIVVEAEAGLGSITCSFNSPTRIFTVDIFGTGGALHVDGNYHAVVRYGPIDSGMNAWARGLAALRDITARSAALVGTTARVLAGQYSLETYGHRYLIERCIRALQGRGEYPISLANAREAVRLLELAFQEIAPK